MKNVGYMMLGMALSGMGIGAYMYLGYNKSKKSRMKNMYTLSNNNKSA